MKAIKIVEMQGTEQVSEAELKAVKGGAGYIKFDGVDGEAKDSGHEKWIDVLSVSSPIYR